MRLWKNVSFKILVASKNTPKLNSKEKQPSHDKEATYYVDVVLNTGTISPIVIPC